MVLNGVLFIIGIISVSVKSKLKISDEYVKLDNLDLDLCKRLRYARINNTNISYWNEIMSNGNDILFKLLVLLTWSSVKPLITLYSKINDLILKLSADEYIKLCDSLDQTCRNTKFNVIQTNKVINKYLTKPSSMKLIYLLSYRFKKELRGHFIHDHKIRINIINDKISHNKINYLMHLFMLHGFNRSVLKEIKSLYNTNSDYNDYNLTHEYTYRSNNLLPLNICRIIMKEPQLYPRILVYLSERSMRIEANKKSRSVSDITQTERWFV